jgi:hypothetical protein
MSVALRMALDRDPDAALGTLATAGTALVVAVVAAAGEAPSRGPHLNSAWPFLLAGLLSPGAAQIFVTIAILCGLGLIKYVGIFFLIVMALLMICIGVLLPLFMGIVHAAFYEELIGEEKEEPFAE